MNTQANHMDWSVRLSCKIKIILNCIQYLFRFKIERHFFVKMIQFQIWDWIYEFKYDQSCIAHDKCTGCAFRFSPNRNVQ